MAQPAGQLVDQLLARTRDPWGIATTRTFVRELLTHAQWMVNLASPSVIDTCVMPTHRMRVLYDLATVGLTQGDVPVARDDVMRVEAVRDDQDKDLVMVEWRSYAHRDQGWVRHVAGQHRLWSRLGRDIIALYPARDIDSAVSLLYVKRTAHLTSDDITTEVRDDRLPAVLALAEGLLLTHRRLYPPAISALNTLERLLARLPRAGGHSQAGFGSGGIGDAA